MTMTPGDVLRIIAANPRVKEARETFLTMEKVVGVKFMSDTGFYVRGKGGDIVKVDWISERWIKEDEAE